VHLLHYDFQTILGPAAAGPYNVRPAPSSLIKLQQPSQVTGVSLTPATSST